SHPTKKNLRITLHRSIQIGEEKELLQQTCDYPGDPLHTAGRTFPADTATIGIAYQTRKIARSKKGIKPDRLAAVMKTLNLSAASRAMSEGVSFVMAVPILEPLTKFTLPSPVAAVIYIDSNAQGFFIEDAELQQLVAKINGLLSALRNANAFDRI